eukprot:CAMPEP_0194361540 /NCGR_PEP_ID=MMETSP0174-20130528/9103_1 /TAXON_ID=216777 /ORGANISM="Proboscia alata, Strain PI-D3" /LENGTH=183 /DNA_ID=CAMNT_0039133793 /DNA_START=647 /DNA_END=1195 /DNA_ORIENTATION=-
MIWDSTSRVSLGGNYDTGWWLNPNNLIITAHCGVLVWVTLGSADGHSKEDRSAATNGRSYCWESYNAFVMLFAIPVIVFSGYFMINTTSNQDLEPYFFYGIQMMVTCFLAKEIFNEIISGTCKNGERSSSLLTSRKRLKQGGAAAIITGIITALVLGVVAAIGAALSLFGKICSLSDLGITLW